MEKTTLINGNGQPYEREIPMVSIAIPNGINDIALAHLKEQTGIDFQIRWGTTLEGQPETWEQFSKIFLTYNFLTSSQNNCDGNIMHLRFSSYVPNGATLYYEMDGVKILGVDGWR